MGRPKYLNDRPEGRSNHRPEGLAEEERRPLPTPARHSDRSARFSLQPASGRPLRPEGLAKTLLPTPTGDAPNPCSLLFSNWRIQGRMGLTDRGRPLGKDQETDRESKAGRTSQTAIPRTVSCTPAEIVLPCIPAETVLCNLPGTTEPKQCCRRRHFPLQYYGRH